MAALAALLAVALALTLTQRSDSPAATTGIIRFALTSDDTMSVDAGSTRPFAFSPDGKSVVFRASRDSVGARLWIRSLADPVARPIDGTEDGLNPVFSPDGEWIAFVTQNVNIKKVRAAGGAVTPIIRTTSRTAALTWGDDDNIYFEQLGSSEGIHRVAASGGRAEVAIPIDTAGDEVAQRRPFFIHGTGTIAFSSGSRGGGEPKLNLYRIPDARRATLDLSGIGVLGHFDGRLVYSRSDGTLMAAPVDVRGMKSEGPPVPLEPRVAAASTGTAVSISPQGTLVYGAAPTGGLLPLALVDTSGRVQMLSKRVQQGSLLFSPDGKRVLFGSPGQPGEPDAQDLQVIDINTGVSTKLRTSGNALYVSWSADGRRLYAPRSADGVVEVMNVPLDGAPEIRLVSLPAAGGGSAMATPDGRSLVYGAVFDRNGGSGILRAWIDGSEKLDTLVLESRDRIVPFRPRVSPDGRAIAFVDRNTGDVYVQSLLGGGALQVSELPSRFQRAVVWGADSRTLYYSGATGLNIIEIETSPALRVVRRMVKPGFPIGQSYDLAPDGKTFVTSSPNNSGLDIWVVVNWLDEARRVWSKR
jgi:Tol biopolymer transport system component